MKHCKYLLLMLMAVLAFASCEKEEDETSGFSKYLRMKINSCERFGDVLRIDFTMTNVSGKDLEDIEFSGVSGLSGKILGSFFSFIVFCIFAL